MYSESRTNRWQRGPGCYAPECDTPEADSRPFLPPPPPLWTPQQPKSKFSETVQLACPATQVQPVPHPAENQAKSNHSSSHWRRKWLPERSPASTPPTPAFSPSHSSAEASRLLTKEWVCIFENPWTRSPAHLCAAEAHSHFLAAAPRSAPPRELASQVLPPAECCSLGPGHLEMSPSISHRPPTG